MDAASQNPSDQPDDAADRHVARWRDHWIDIDFDGTTEAIVMRMDMIMRYLRRAKEQSVAEVGLQGFEYDTLHDLMIRDTPGIASPSELAAVSGVSPAGMTGRLDTLEKAGYVRRHSVEGDRRRVQVEATPKGIAIWREAILLRGGAEDALLGILDAGERDQLSALLRRVTLAVESADPDAV